jgi:hypothetical protein
MNEIETFKELYKRGEAEVCDFVELADLLAEQGHEHGDFLCELASNAVATEDLFEMNTYIAMFLSLIGYEDV